MRDSWIGRLVGRHSISSLGVDGHRVLDVGPHPHLLLEVNLRQLITLLSVFDLTVTFVDQVIAGSNVVVTIVLNALLRVLPVEVILFEKAVE